MELRELRKWVHGYQARFGRDKAPHAPDDAILAQLLALAPCHQVVRMIENLMAEHREPGYQYAWYVTVALQRIHGIGPGALKARRAELRVAPHRGTTLSGEQQPLLPDQNGNWQTGRELLDEIEERRGRKAKGA